MTPARNNEPIFTICGHENDVLLAKREIESLIVIKTGKMFDQKIGKEVETSLSELLYEKKLTEINSNQNSINTKYNLKLLYI